MTAADINHIKAEYVRGGTSYRKLAEKYGITPGNVSTTLHRTRRKLQKYLKEEGLC